MQKWIITTTLTDSVFSWICLIQSTGDFSSMWMTHPPAFLCCPLARLSNQRQAHVIAYLSSIQKASLQRPAEMRGDRLKSHVTMLLSCSWPWQKRRLPRNSCPLLNRRSDSELRNVTIMKPSFPIPRTTPRVWCAPLGLPTKVLISTNIIEIFNTWLVPWMPLQTEIFVFGKGLFTSTTWSVSKIDHSATVSHYSLPTGSKLTHDKYCPIPNKSLHPFLETILLTSIVNKF